MRTQITIVQRNATCVLSSASAEQSLYKLPFSDKTPIEELDLRGNSTSLAFSLQLMKSGGAQRVKTLDKELHEGLRKAGFKLTWELSPGSGEVGLEGFLIERSGSGTSAIVFFSKMISFSNAITVLDSGCGKLIVEGRVKVRESSSCRM